MLGEQIESGHRGLFWCICGHSGSCWRLVVYEQPIIIYVQHVITTSTSTEVNYPHCLPVSQFAPSFLGLSDPDARDWNQVTRLPSPLSH